jgi:hypothetical protein
MSDFSSRAAALVRRLEVDGSDPVARSELSELRSLWRTLSADERRAAAPLASALAAAQAREPRQLAFVDEDAAARKALRGLDRIEELDDTIVGRPYHGPRDPDALLAHFGLPAFRPGQRDAVAAALAGRDSLVVMPTGGGKSLCYQLPGIASEDLTVVVSPLIALMADQYRRLRPYRAVLAGAVCLGVVHGRAGRAARGPVRGRRGSLRVRVGPRFPS